MEIEKRLKELEQEAQKIDEQKKKIAETIQQQQDLYNRLNTQMHQINGAYNELKKLSSNEKPAKK